MIRTGHYWLSILPDDIKENFLKNHGDYDGYLDIQESFFDFINGSFAWYQTDEGSLYWYDIAKKDPMEFIKIKRDSKINNILEND